YDIEQVDFASLEKTTAAGNPYTHDLSNPLVENGRYVYRYVCEEELRSGWNQIASIAYDSAGASGYAVKETLLRYLTSKGLRKDASGVKALNQEDVRNIEQGVANYIYKKNAFSLYPRIYSTIWEYYVYTNTGYSDKQSFSQRIEFARAALTIIRQHPFFGVGAGDWKKAFHEAYDQNASTLNKELRGTAHNQYLNYLVKFGILGLLSIVFCFAYPVLKSRRYTDPLFVLFLVLMMAVNLGDSNLESHMGLSFFLFFYCLFLAADGTAYLRLKVRPRT
ncbi:MAG TPA: O-antigen ligase family protein, partial [Prolixibacteraceae bacterium]|nr:O-antigen ligase family protein [Prolixibacteraceae bacterium]